MNKIPSSLVSLTVLLLHVFAMPVFFLGFILIYESRWIMEFLHTGPEMEVFNTLMLTSILIGVIAVSRITMSAVGRKHRFSWWQYALWSFGEVFIYSCFAALYMALIYGTYGYFPALAKCMQVSLATLSYPYIIFAILFAYIRSDEDEVAEEDLIRFVDNTGRLKPPLHFAVTEEAGMINTSEPPISTDFFNISSILITNLLLTLCVYMLCLYPLYGG